MSNNRLATLAKDSILVGLITLVLFEVVLRMFFAEGLSLPTVLPERTAEHLFWQKDVQLGWTHQPNASGVFTNGHFVGHVHLGAQGERLNAIGGTYNPDYENILFIGDSTTVSFEVDDDSTVPALLEAQLRLSGRRVNVINLGVRGYGTDQSVLRALLMAKMYKPVEIIYMYTDNDMYNNNVLRQGRRKYGKGVYLSDGLNAFHAYNYPVPEYKQGYAGLILFDEQCKPVVYQTSLPVQEKKMKLKEKLTVIRKTKDMLNNNMLSYRALARLKQALDLWVHPVVPKKSVQSGVYVNILSDRLDRLDLDLRALIDMRGVKWSDDFSYAYTEGGFYRDRCSTYLENQFQFLIKKLKSIPTVKAIHLVEFPSEERGFEQIKAGKERVNHLFFQKLLRGHAIDSYLDLYQKIADERLERQSFSCIDDPHFCTAGNHWIADRLMKNLSLLAGSTGDN